MIGNDACGSHSVAWGRTAESVVALELLLLDDGTCMAAGATSAGGRAGPPPPLPDLGR